MDGPSIKKHSDIQPLHHKSWENLVSEFGPSSFTASKTNLFPPFLDTKPFFAMQVTRVGIMTVFLSLALRYHQIKIARLEFLQRCDTQIRVNTWTGSFYYFNLYLLFYLRPNLFRYSFGHFMSLQVFMDICLANSLVSKYIPIFVW